LKSNFSATKKGAPTGAYAKKMGRFEVAHDATLFWDAIGELPFKLQPKLRLVVELKKPRKDVKKPSRTLADVEKANKANDHEKVRTHRQCSNPSGHRVYMHRQHAS
jgi:DNA-binding NtrC family response regulator